MDRKWILDLAEPILKKAEEESEEVNYDEADFTTLLECVDNLDPVAVEALSKYMQENYPAATGAALEKAVEAFISDYESVIIPAAQELLEHLRNA